MVYCKKIKLLADECKSLRLPKKQQSVRLKRRTDCKVFAQSNGHALFWKILTMPGVQLISESSEQAI